MISVVIPHRPSRPSIRNAIIRASIRLVPLRIQRSCHRRRNWTQWLQVQLRTRHAVQIRSPMQRQPAKHTPRKIDEPGIHVARVRRKLLHQTSNAGARRQSRLGPRRRKANQHLRIDGVVVVTQIQRQPLVPMKRTAR